MRIDNDDRADLSRVVGLPKAEVHVHLEGSFEALTLEKWSREAGVVMPRPPDRLFEFQGLSDFLEFLDWACRALACASACCVPSQPTNPSNWSIV